MASLFLARSTQFLNRLTPVLVGRSFNKCLRKQVGSGFYKTHVRLLAIFKCQREKCNDIELEWILPCVFRYLETGSHSFPDPLS